MLDSVFAARNSNAPLPTFRREVPFNYSAKTLANLNEEFLPEISSKQVNVQCNWLFSAKLDILFFFAPLFLAIVLLKLSQTAFLFSALSLFLLAEVLPAAGVSHLAASWSHYLDSENRNHYFGHWVKRLTFVVIPLSLIGLTALAFFLKLDPLIGLIYLVWTMQHLTQQNIGILLLYHNPGEATLLRSMLARSLRIPAVAMGVLYIIRMSEPNIPNLALIFGGGFICLASSIYYGLHIFQEARRGAPINLPAFLFWLSSTWFFLPIIILNGSHYECFMLPLFAHWCQYLGLNSILFSRKYKSAKTDGVLKSPHLRKVLLFVAIFTAIFISLDHLCIPIASPLRSALAGLLLGLTFAHYFVDAFMWKFREPFQRKAILAFLKIRRPT